MRKLLATFVVALLLLSACVMAAFPASAADGINYDDWLIFDGSIIEYCGSDTEVVIPTVDAEGLPITIIGPKAFYENKTIEKVVIPEGITEIKDEAFMRCTYLCEVTLPYSLSKVGHSTFLSAEGLVEMKIPGNLKKIPKDFIGNTAISELVISYGVEEIACDAFGMLQTTEIIVPETVYDIGACAFNSFGSNVGERLEIYITNDDCTLGVNNGDQYYFPEDWGQRGQFAELQTWENGGYNKVTKMHVYGLKDGKVKAYVSEFMNDGANKPWAYAIFHDLDTDELAEKNQWCKDNAVQKPDADSTNKDNKGENKQDDSDDKDTAAKKDSNTNVANNANDNSLIITIVIAAAAVVVVIVIAVVVIVLVLISKKSKKKKKNKKEKKQEESKPQIESEQVIEENSEQE